MRKIPVRVIILIASMNLLGGCAGFLPFGDRNGEAEKSGSKQESSSAAAGKINPDMSGRESLSLGSRSFEDYGKLDQKHWMDSGNISPELHWSGVPSGTASLALIVYDFTPEAQKWLHWGVVNIPPAIREIPQGASLTGRMPRGALETLNSYDYILDNGSRGWAGPAPAPSRKVHEYRFLLVALDRVIPPPAPEECVDAESLYYVLEPYILSETFITALSDAARETQ